MMLSSQVMALRFQIRLLSDAGEPSERTTLMLKYFFASDCPLSAICRSVNQVHTAKPTRVRPAVRARAMLPSLSGPESAAPATMPATIGPYTIAEKIRPSTREAPNRGNRSASTIAALGAATSRTLARGGAYGFALGLGLALAGMSHPFE